jgi:hypothetical protein
MRTIIILLLSFVLVSCGTLKKSVHKESETATKSEDVTNTTKTTIKETADTTIKVPGDTAKATTSLEQLLSGETIRANNSRASIAIHYDKATNSITAQAIAEPVSVPIRINRQTTIESTTKSETKEKASREVIDKQVDRKPTSFFNWLFIVLCLIGVAAVAYLIHRFVPKF